MTVHRLLVALLPAILIGCGSAGGSATGESTAALAGDCDGLARAYQNVCPDQPSCAEITEKMKARGCRAGHWYATCGEPVCHGWEAKPGIPLCNHEQIGAPCGNPEDTCDPHSDCNSLLVCATASPIDPKYGCPISRKRFKKDIRYLSTEDLQRLNQELGRMRLASYRYKAESSTTREHLGFLIDDVEPSAAVTGGSGDSVDLYGYTSMAVAAIQIQAQEIQQLKRQVALLNRAHRGRHLEDHDGLIETPSLSAERISSSN